MKLMTFNIRHALGLDERIDLERVIAVIAKSQVDVVALQEVDRYMPRSGNVDQAAKIGRALHMEWCFAASLRIGLSEYGNAILSKYKILDHEVTFLPGEKERRSLLRARLHTDIGPMIMMTTHLGVTERDRTRQFPILLAQLAEVNSQAVLMGDFNMESDHSLMRELTDSGWQEAEREGGFGTVIGGRTIDHIYTKAVGIAFAAHSEPADASDHCPVVAEICQNMVQ
jgi:endonuclease/exonuclease/phosphatase family metal-dependent hydrolase